MRRYYRDDPSPRRSLNFNATPLVDVIFLLTIFFVLVSKLSQEELRPIELPTPEKSQARAEKVPDRVVVNCRFENPDGAGDIVYDIGPNREKSLPAIGQLLAAKHRANPRMKVVVRADRRLPYSAVRSVMRVLAANNIEVLNVGAHLAEGPS